MNERSLPTVARHYLHDRLWVPTWLVIALAVACGLAAPFLVEHLTHPPNGARFTYLAIAAAAGAAILAEVSIRGFIGLFSPLSATMLGFIWFFCAGPVLKPEMNAELYARATNYLPLAGLVVLGMACLALGYATAPRLRMQWLISRLDRLDRRLTPRRLLKLQLSILALLIALLGLTAVLIGTSPIRFLTESMYGVETAPQQAMAHPIARYPYQMHRSVLIALCGISALLLSFRGATFKGRTTALLGFALATILAAARGSRFILLYATGGGLLLLLIRALPTRNRVSRVATWSRVVVVFVALLTLGFAGLQLVELRRGGSPLENLAEGKLGGLYDLIDYGADMNRTLDASLQLVPDEQSYLWGETYLSVFTLFIPRVLWAQKPEPLSSYLFRASGSTVQNVSFSNLGELHANFGLIGIAVGMWLTGIIFSACWKVFLENRHNSVVVMFYALLPFTAAFMVRGDFSTAAGAALYSWALTFAGLRFVTRHGIAHG